MLYLCANEAIISTGGASFAATVPPPPPPSVVIFGGCCCWATNDGAVASSSLRPIESLLELPLSITDTWEMLSAAEAAGRPPSKESVS